MKKALTFVNVLPFHLTPVWWTELFLELQAFSSPRRRCTEINKHLGQSLFLGGPGCPKWQLLCVFSCIACYQFFYEYLSYLLATRGGSWSGRAGGGVAHRGQSSPPTPLPSSGHPWGSGSAASEAAWRPLRLVGVSVRQVPGASSAVAGEGDAGGWHQTGFQAPHHWVSA